MRRVAYFPLHFRASEQISPTLKPAALRISSLETNMFELHLRTAICLNGCRPWFCTGGIVNQDLLSGYLLFKIGAVIWKSQEKDRLINYGYGTAFFVDVSFEWLHDLSKQQLICKLYVAAEFVDRFFLQSRSMETECQTQSDNNLKKHIR